MSGDRLFALVSRVFAFTVLGIVAVTAAVLFVGALPAIRAFGFSFLVSSAWDPVAGRFGALPFIYGTLVSSALALAIAIPLSLGIAIFLSELAPALLMRPVRFLVELLAAIPSVIYGLWGIAVLVPWLRVTVEPALGRWFGAIPLFSGPPFGIGMLAAGLILSIMVIPIISSIACDVLRAVPDDQREGALALGATRWEATRIAVLRYGRSGITGAIFLGLGRALGETMAVTMVIGNRPEIALSLFAPGHTMASVIANEFTEATADLHLSALYAIGFALFGITLLVNAAARALVWRTTRFSGGGRS